MRPATGRINSAARFVISQSINLASASQHQQLDSHLTAGLHDESGITCMSLTTTLRGPALTLTARTVDECTDTLVPYSSAARFWRKFRLNSISLAHRK